MRRVFRIRAYGFQEVAISIRNDKTKDKNRGTEGKRRAMDMVCRKLLRLRTTQIRLNYHSPKLDKSDRAVGDASR